MANNMTPPLGHEYYRNIASTRQIPKILHFVWVGDESKCPHACIDSWREHHPDWEIRIWGNDDYHHKAWRLKHHMQAMWDHELNGVADMMRYEILFEHGGIALDADSFCIRPIPDWILQCEAAAASENEILNPLLIACGFLATIPGNPFYNTLISNLESNPNALHKAFLGFRYQFRAAWKTVGPRYFSKIYRQEKYVNMTILPSHFFYPDTKRGEMQYRGNGPVFAYQLWKSTFADY